MNYSATLLLSFKKPSLQVDRGDCLLCWGMRGNLTSVDTPELLFVIFYFSVTNLAHIQMLVDRLTNEIAVGMYLAPI